MSEEWRPVPEGWPYEVSKDGIVRRSQLPRRYGRTQVGKKLKWLMERGRPTPFVQLCDRGRKWQIRVLKLVEMVWGKKYADDLARRI